MSSQANSRTEPSTGKAKYRVTNWPEYDRAWVQRGRLIIWFDEAFLRERWGPAPTGKRGAPFSYSAIAIEVVLTLTAGVDRPYRRLEGVAGSIVPLMGVEVRIPDHTLLARRAKTLTINIPRRQRTGPVPVVVESTGLKIYREGEGKVRQPGAGQRRPGRTVPLAVDADAKASLGVEVTTPAWTDGAVFEGGLEPVEGDIAQVDGDGADDTPGVYDTARARGATVAVPPRENAVPWEENHPRTPAWAALAEKGLAEWNKTVGYPRRRLAEPGRYRLKPWCGERLASRLFETQVPEVHVRVAALHGRTYLGRPVAVAVRGSLS